MKSIQTFLEEFNYIPFGEKPKILLEAWDKFFTIHRAQPEDSNELFKKLLEDLKELTKYYRPIFFDNNVNHSVRNKESIEILLMKLLLRIPMKRRKDHHKILTFEVKNVVEQPAERGNSIAPILSTKEPEYSPSMGYENPNTTPEMESDEIIKSGVEELVQILSENEVNSEDKKECDMPVFENSPICDDHSDIFSDSKNDDDISSDDDDFEDIEYVEASLTNL
nr:hypothetical protein [Tanacetum cinerariifolium]